jgi:hypothetical protein
MLDVADPYETKVLKRDVHDRLVKNLTNYAEDAGIQKHWVWTPLVDHVSAVEFDYVKTFPKIRSEGMVKGLVLTRKTAEADPYERMSAMAGAFVRNFIRARMMTVQHVLGLLKDGDAPVATVLLIPNFFHSKDEGGSIPQWQASHLYDLLLQRASEGKQTVLYATDIGEMGTTYGSAFSRFISTNYTKAEI